MSEPQVTKEPGVMADGSRFVTMFYDGVPIMKLVQSDEQSDQDFDADVNALDMTHPLAVRELAKRREWGMIE